jgi:murein DD-endopeptidase MepM/ murein hydrolase activator NlpD
MTRQQQLQNYIETHRAAVGKVVDFDRGTDRLYKFNFTEENKELSADDVADTAVFSAWVTQQLVETKSRYGVGGYFEHRNLYGRSPLFDTDTEPRRLHLGVDIWASAGTPVYAPLDGKVHSFRDNNNFGDYGPTIILEHNLDGLTLYSLYGHLNRECLVNLHEGMPILMNQQIAVFGNAIENGGWPPHLHFQLMFDMQGLKGDYPGVCRYSEKDIYQANVPDPDLLLNFQTNL